MKRPLALRFLSPAALLLLAGCGTEPVVPSPAHLTGKPAPQGDIPPPVQQSVILPPPKAAPKVETYSVVVNDVPVRELLFALARDAKLNVDIHPGIEGNVTLNALDQTLPQLLSRIAKQVDMRYELDGPNLAVMPDTPYLKQYRIDYLNMSRDVTSNVSIATQIATSGTGNVTSATGSSGTTGMATGGVGGRLSNNSSTSVTNTSNNRFWETLVQNVQDLLRETDKLLPAGSSETTVEQTSLQSTTGTGAIASGARNTTPSLATSPNPAAMQSNNAMVTRRSTYREAASVIANPENGVLAVRATARQHEKVQEFLDQVMASARRQVMIEATVVEVELSDQYQQGINWNLASLGGKGWKIANNTGTSIDTIAAGTSGTSTVNTSPFSVGYLNTTSKFGSIAAAVSLLENFGRLKVLSSPKISVLNNQTAMLKVVENKVYFTITAQQSAATATSGALATYTTEARTVPVGFVMSVTPQVSNTGEITLNVRPTVSRISGWVSDPGLALNTQNQSTIKINSDCTTGPQSGQVQSCIPVIQAKEMESVLRLEDRQIAIMGGLMEDGITHKNNAVPGLSSIPLVGEAFKNRDETTTQKELVIFLRPTIIKEPGLDGDYSEAGISLPDRDFFKPSLRKEVSAGGEGAQP
ncbi:MAG: type II and III secretion system protein [Sulfuricellaceae bacterium]|jgi:MSHA biogenesis protein MshL